MAETLARRDAHAAEAPRPTYRTDRSFEWNHANGPDFDGPWPAVPPTPTKTVFGLKLNSRFGVPASILLNSRWIGTYARLGFDLVTYKTVRAVQRLCLRMRTSAVLGPASPRNMTIRVHDDATNGRIGRNASKTAPRQRQSQRHEAIVVGVRGHPPLPSGSFNWPMMFSKSFASRKFL